MNDDSSQDPAVRSSPPDLGRRKQRPIISRFLIGFSIIGALGLGAFLLGRGVLNSVLQGNTRLNAKKDCVQLVNSIKMFYTEYNRYPVAGGGAGEGPFDTNRQLMDVLTNNRNSPEVAEMNPWGIAFFEPSKISKKPKGHGFVEGTRDFNDPWGTPYQVYIDVDYDGQVQAPPGYGGPAAGSPLKRGVIAHSAGPDRSFSKTRDNVTSWK